MLFALISPALSRKVNVRAQSNEFDAEVQRLFSNMSVEERVGQVFLVSFQGANIHDDSPIVSLIENKHIGGVVIRRNNDNLTGPDNTTEGLQQLTINLQKSNRDAARAANRLSSYSPLFIAMSQEGDMVPGDQVLFGVTSLPNQMTIGATWNRDFAEAAGTVLGVELRALGINMLLGPSLDVLDSIRTDGRDDLGVRSFGGNPFWVGKMGRAFIEGVHIGSENQVAVVATHFPGTGSSDRQPDTEIATVRRTIEQLLQIELAPFFVVTNMEQDQASIVDGLLLSHTRYQGFQGSIRPSTKPVSFDPVAVDAIMKLPQLNPWREMGGVIISDDLGSEAVRKFVDPLSTGFDARQVARTALMAGNDLLYMGNIIATGDADSYTTVERTIDYFVQKYEEDSAFQMRVDDAVLQILQLKRKIYPSFEPVDVLASANDLEKVGQNQAGVMEIAQSAVTLISPSAEDLPSVLPDPPKADDRIVFISDELTFSQCSTCPAVKDFPAVTLMNSLIHLYGSGAGDPINSQRLSAFSYENLRMILEGGQGTEDVQSALNAANWIVFSFREFGTERVESATFRRLFDERPDLIRGKKIIGLAFNAPYYLDSTDISKLSAYYALYSKTPEFYDVASRVLMQELSPTGRLPVSVPGIGYDLADIISPDPLQVIPLVIESPENAPAPENPPPAGYSQPLLYKAGDTIPIKAGVIVDNNGNPVPDGTLVRFIIDTRSTSGSVEQLEARTVDGFARVMYVIPSIGSLQLSVTADPAFASSILRLDITDLGGVVTSFEPTAVVEQASDNTPTEIPPTPIPENNAERLHKEGKVAFSDWFIANLLIIAACVFYSRVTRSHASARSDFLMVVFLGAGGYLAYLLVALGVFSTGEQVMKSGTIYVLIVVAAGLLMGFICGMVYRWWEKRKLSLAQNRDKQGDQAHSNQ